MPRAPQPAGPPGPSAAPSGAAGLVADLHRALFLASTEPAALLAADGRVLDANAAFAPLAREAASAPVQALVRRVAAGDAPQAEAEGAGGRTWAAQALRDGAGRLLAVALRAGPPSPPPAEGGLFRSIVEYSSNLFYVHDADHRLSYVSPQSRAFLDCDPEEAKVRWTEFLTDHPVNALGIAATERALATGQRQPPYELELRTREGRTVWVEVNEAPVLQGDRVVGMVGALTDITERKRAQDRAEGAQREVQDYIDGLAALAVKVAPDGRVLLANQTSKHVSGLGDGLVGADFPGGPWFAHDPSVAARVREAFQAALRGAPQRLEAPVLVAGGQVRHLGIVLTPLAGDDGRVRAVIAEGHDMTEAKRAEARLRESERLLEEAEGLAHLGSWEWDVASDQVTWSRELCRIFGVPTDGFGASYQAYLGFVHPDDRGRVDGVVRATFAQGDAFAFDHRIVRPDGTVRELHGQGRVFRAADGRPARMAGTAEDVTERRAIERALRQSEERYRLILATIEDGYFEVDLRGVLRDVNGATARFFGRPREQLLGRSYREFVDADNARRIFQAFHRVYRTGDAVKGFEVTLRTAPGDDLTLETSVSLVHDADGRPAGFHGIIRDVTERKAAEAAHREALERAAELERLQELNAFKTRFINTAAHELGTPLTPIRMQVHLLKEGHGGELSEAQRKAVTILDRNVERLGSLVRDLLEAGRLQAGRLGLALRELDLNRVVAESAESFQEAARAAGIRLDVELGEGRPVPADGPRVTQVLFNLLSNALKFTPRGGAVRVRTAFAGEVATVRIEDDGIGIRAEDLPRLFQPFSQVHDTGQRAIGGTGLGLYISKGIVELHGGRIWAESAGAGLGAAFAFQLPCRGRPEAQDAGANR